MKKSVFLVFSLTFVLSLTACGSNNVPTTSSSLEPAPSESSGTESSSGDSYEGRIKEKTFKVLNISYERMNANDPRYFEDPKNISTYTKADEYKLYYLDKVDEVYYMSLETFVNLFKGDFKDGVTNEVKEENGVSTWTSKMGEQTYTLSVNKNEQTYSTLGTVEDFFKTVTDGRIGLFDQMDQKLTYVEGHEDKVKTYSFKKYGFDVFDVDGKACYPFSLLLCETSKYMDRKFLNASNSNYLVEYVDSKQFEELEYVLDGSAKTYLFSDLIASSFKTLYGDNFGIVSMPVTLAEFNKKLVYFLFDNFYGLASTRGIKSMSSYFDNLEVSSKYFTDPNGLKRGSAYYYALQGLNDLHTLYSYSGYMNEGASSEAINDQSLFSDRVHLSILLGSLRAQAIKNYNTEHSTSVNEKKVRYSRDGKYAYFSFDLFDTFHYYEQGEIPESELFGDCYYQFLMNLQEIKSKGVKRVFIDDSLNGGGYVALMGKLLALMSKDNKSTMYLRDEGNDSITEVTTRVDSNKDGVYDARDSFGNDFEFYIITSPYSFSCGNAFPFFAKTFGIAEVIGQRSGGGECCVYGFSFPTGQGIGYSSPLHIGYYNKETKVFSGDEAGTYPWLSLDTDLSLYDVDVLAERVTARSPFKD